MRYGAFGVGALWPLGVDTPRGGCATVAWNGCIPTRMERAHPGADALWPLEVDTPRRMKWMHPRLAKNCYFARLRRKWDAIWRNIHIMRAATAEAGEIRLLCTLSGEISLSWRAK